MELSFQIQIVKWMIVMMMTLDWTALSLTENMDASPNDRENSSDLLDSQKHHAFSGENSLDLADSLEDNKHDDTPKNSLDIAQNSFEPSTLNGKPLYLSSEHVNQGHDENVDVDLDSLNSDVIFTGITRPNVSQKRVSRSRPVMYARRTLKCK